MTYGLDIFNSKGERVVEFKSTLYARSSGNTKSSSTVLSEAGVLADAAGYPASWRKLYNFDFSVAVGGVNGQHFAEQNAWAASIDGFRVLGPESNLTLGDMVFYRIDSVGITAQLQVFCDFGGLFPSDKGVGVAFTENDVSIPYLHASVVAPTGSGETYGMTLHDEFGATTFDSRKPLFSVFHAEVISKTLFDDVLLNNATRTITLPKAVSGAYVSMPSFINFRAVSPGGNAVDYVMAKQTDSTTITFTKKRVYGSDDTGTVKLWTQDTPFFVGRPI